MQLKSLSQKIFLTVCFAVTLTNCGGPNFWPYATLTVLPTVDFESDRRAAERIATEMGFARSPSANEGKIFWEDTDPWLMFHLYKLPSNVDIAVSTGQKLETGTLMVILSDASVGGFEFQGEGKYILVDFVGRMRDEFGSDRVKIYTREPIEQIDAN